MSLNDLNYDMLIENLGVLDDWEERYKYILDLGRLLPEFPSDYKNDSYIVRGCVSQVWLKCHKNNDILSFDSDSDSHLVRGLIAIVMIIYSHQTVQNILETDFKDYFEQMGLSEHLTPQRSNGIFSVVSKIKEYAQIHQ
jgi:cysteine desulfuration protein SufE